MLEVFSHRNFAPIDYEEALRLQSEANTRSASGWMFFASTPVITLGTRASVSDVLLSADELRRQNIKSLRVDRGGLVTYHGPGQVLGFPFGNLEKHVRDPRGVKIFMKDVQTRLMGLIAEFSTNTLSAEACGKPMGIWMEHPEKGIQKVVAFGMRFLRQGFAHGFAMNLYRDEEGNGRGFQMIVACGDKESEPGFVFSDKPSDEILNRFNARLLEIFQKEF